MFCYFNSRPHEEVDNVQNATTQQTGISTHDLTKRSTLAQDRRRRTLYISTHDLTKRSTMEFLTLNLRKMYFNSRPHEEVDHSVRKAQYPIKISTHDLTKRSTVERALIRWIAIFQLTTSRRGRREFKEVN